MDENPLDIQILVNRKMKRKKNKKNETYYNGNHYYLDYNI